MTAAAWITLAGVIVTSVVVVLTNVVIITRFLSALEGKILEWKAEIKGELGVMKAEHHALVNSTHSAQTQLRTDQEKTEQRHDRRLQNLERIVGRSSSLHEE